MGSEELFGKARRLDALAEEVEVLADPAVRFASSPNWECPNASDVRGHLTSLQTSARNAAGHLRAEAGTVRGQARAALERENEQGRQENGRAK